MTEPLSDPLALLPELIVEVRELNAGVAKLASQSRRHRVALVVAFVSIVLDVAITLFITYAVHRYNNLQDCRNTRSAAFFNAEIAKVQGQVRGLLEIRNSNGDPAAGSAGFDQFIRASQHYLATIHSIKGACQ